MNKLEFDSDRFKEIVISNKLNTNELANNIGVSEKNILNWMDGISIPSNGYEQKINKIIGTELFYTKKSDKKSKYKNNKTMVDGIKFDSVKEAKRYSELKIMEKAGKLKDLRRQVKYVLIPAQKNKDGKSLERECSYLADFVYTDENGNTIVEDTKGVRTTSYVIKRKLMLYVHNIKIKEI